ncbi:NIPSNAP family protein [Mucilaginibacter sabulilitoris]|uniref:NIPSNAP family protein n=1 Tax=Mucilaginibacter sabulilitoris TaxID=1173583 RepID=A0ABZ0TR37_9SPHI|nr:NIPSNAP family protein [Mucilaginibacter sabulilitoris]WPU94219.1 NIPSNAP family protein [Mucilaginibacter sabulilitoris]
MKRRSFVKASLLTGAAASILPNSSMATSVKAKPGTEFYELRVYNLKNETQQKLVEDYFQNAAIPALNKLGSKNVGVFTELKPEGQTKIYVLIPYNSIADFLNVQEKLDQDAVYKEKGASYLTAPASEPAYERIESSLLKAFVHMPKMEVSKQGQRIFELRRYEHATESAGKKKLEMFNDAGEIDIFKKLGFSPVFFGETLIGDHRPNLIYMITFDDLDAKAAHWKAFGSDPEWKKVSAIPDYSDSKLVSHITSTLLQPAACSQI